jgi:hypothetical protein
MIAAAPPDERTPEKILEEIIAIRYPTRPDPRDAGAMAVYQAEYRKRSDEQFRLVAELIRVAPTHPRIGELLKERWGTLIWKDEAKVFQEASQLLALPLEPTLRIEVSYWKLQGAFSAAFREGRPQDALPAIDEFAILAPNDDRAAYMISSVAMVTDDLAAREALFERITTSYAGRPILASIPKLRDAAASASRKQVRTFFQRVGKPCELTFKAAVSGEDVSTTRLKGKVIVLICWASTNEASVAEMARFKSIQAKYDDKGVFFAGVCYDQLTPGGSLDTFTEFVSKSGITWPNDCPEQLSPDGFPPSWLKQNLPVAFLIDADGVLVSINAIRKLEQLIPEALAKAKSKAGR